MKEEYTNLGKKTFWWKVRIVVLLPFWLTSMSETKKSWSEFKHGLIKHECEWDYDNPDQDQFAAWASCKHHGCNMVHVIKYS